MGEPAPIGPASDDPDGVLLEHFRAGCEDAAQYLYDRYASRLKAMAAGGRAPDLSQRLDADDIVQSVFRSFFRRASRGQYQVPDGEDLWKLLLVITLHKLRSAGAFHRAAKRDVRATRGGDRLLDLASSQRGFDEAAFLEMRLLIGDLVARLPEAQRRMIELRLEGHEVAEIAVRTQRSKRSVERVLQDFRGALRAKLEEDAEA
jgi:RNA polymerase sigma-70 factor (ECF subfamily)